MRRDAGRVAGRAPRAVTAAGRCLGWVTGPATVSELRMRWNECKIAGSAYPCEAAAHEVVLEGELGAITASAPGLRLHPAQGQGTAWVLEFCGGGGFDYAYCVRDAAIAAIPARAGKPSRRASSPAH
jgi:hypothetical protein